VALNALADTLDSDKTELDTTAADLSAAIARNTPGEEPPPA